MTSRLAAVEARPIIPPNAVDDQVARQLREVVDPKLADLFEKSRLGIKAAVESVAVQLRTEIAESMDELRIRAAKSEEELRTALVAQMDIELREAKDQGSALREEIEGRVREVLKERLAELDQRRTREVRELESRLGLLVEGRSKDLEGRLSLSGKEQREQLVQGEMEQFAQMERRLELANEARLAATVEAQTQSLAGLQVRLQTYFDQRMREDQEREREKYVELLARLKTEVDQGLAHTINSAEFDRAVGERVTRSLEVGRVADRKTLEARVAEVNSRLQSQNEAATSRLAQVETRLHQRETALAEVEQSVRRDLEELDRRLQVMGDRMVPLVRNTWLKVDELQKGSGPSAAADARLKDFRREFSRELRRLEGEMLEQTTELRDRMEGAIAHQGRIWLNFVRQMAAAEDDSDTPPTDSAGRSLRRATRAAAASSSEPNIIPLRARPTFQPLAEDPVNPMDPGADNGEPEPLERRRVRRST